MTTQIRDFIEVYKKKSVPKMSIREFIKSHNHEIWRKCPKCGAFEDLRKTENCTECGTELVLK